MERFGNRHFSAFESASFVIAYFPGGKNFFDCQITRLGYNHIHGLFVEFREPFMFAQLLNIQLLVKYEINISAICNDLRHGVSLLILKSYKIL